MSEVINEVSYESIESFLEGSNPKKYVVAIETDYGTNKVHMVVNDPETGKRIDEATYKSFLWFKEDVTTKLYGGKRRVISEKTKQYGITITKLRTCDNHGHSPERLINGFKYLATCTKSYNSLVAFFKEGGLDVFKEENKIMFMIFSPIEQYMIQSGVRMFKGMDDYDSLHRLQFDLETTGLFANRDSVFQIGIRDNQGFEKVLEVDGENDLKKRQCERETIDKFFRIIDIIKPDIITGYNSENFDWAFLFERAERLNISITELAITLNRLSKIRRRSATVKFGGETERYQQTHMYGYNILDISHAVRRAMAINSNIKAWGLKYITQYSNIAKPNRVYVAGDKINTIWADKVNQYAFNDTNGDYYVISEAKPLKENYVIVKGDYIVQRYLCDDLWETEQIDNLFNQASFLIGKIIPTSFQRSSTMGTAGQWKLIMAAWSYENKLAIPETQKKRDFTGGLSRLLNVGYARRVGKLDYAALYPKTQLTHGIFPDLDISGVMRGILTYVVDTRDKFKFLAEKEKKMFKDLEEKLVTEKDTLTKSEVTKIKKEIDERKALFNLYDKKQLPLKILANSWFGSYGAPYIFNWGDTDSAEETTCRGRQYLRLMVKHFTEKYGFKALVLDTDGCNFALPDDLDDFKYVAKGTHWKTEEDGGKELIGLDAVLAEFNETYMIGRMGLDIDEICTSTINFARKNYATDINGKIKLVGNSVKSKKMSVYIEDFLGKAIRMLLDDDGQSFINYYHEYVDKIYNFQIPLVKMASKGKVKLSIADYKKKATMKNKAGNPLPKQAHMELALKEDISITLGDVIYYINVGTSKSHGDLKTIDKNKMTKKLREAYKEEHGEYPKPNKEVQLNCKLIDPSVVEKDFELIKELEMLKKALVSNAENENEDLSEIEAKIEAINAGLYTDEYNVARYLDAFNKKIKPLLVCFNEEVRNNILLDIVKLKDPLTKKVTEQLKERKMFTKADCKLISGIPFKPTDQDSYEDLMIMEDKEIKFWSKVNMVPNNMEEAEWEVIKVDYAERMIKAKADGIAYEIETLDDILRHLEVSDLKRINYTYELPIDVLSIVDIDFDSNKLFSRKWNEPLCSIDDLFKYEKDAIARNEYYIEHNIIKSDDRYEQYRCYVLEQNIMNGTISLEQEVETIVNIPEVILKIKEVAQPQLKVEEVKKPKLKMVESEEDDEEDFEEEDAEGDMVRICDKLILDDEVDDTFGDVPDGYHEIVYVEPKIEVEEDEWNF